MALGKPMKGAAHRNAGRRWRRCLLLNPEAGVEVDQWWFDPAYWAAQNA